MATVLTSLLSISSALTRGIGLTITKQVQNADPASYLNSGDNNWGSFVACGLILLGIGCFIYETFFEKESNEEDEN